MKKSKRLLLVLLLLMAFINMSGRALLSGTPAQQCVCDRGDHLDDKPIIPKSV